MTRVGRPDGGYVLLAVLWIMVGVGGLTFLITAAARTAIAPSRNRMALTAASWTAAGCLAQARDRLTRSLAAAEYEPGDARMTAWNAIDRTLGGDIFNDSPCRVSARALGAKLDVNTSDESTVAMVLLKAGMRRGQADSTAAVVASHRPYLDMRQLHLVPELQTVSVLDSVLDVEAGLTCLNHASGAVLATLPGFTDETVRKVMEDRKHGKLISGFQELGPFLSPDSPEASARLPGVAVLGPSGWVITVRASTGKPSVNVVLEALVIRSEPGIRIARRRSWLE
jgi:hypothetical protein